MTTAIPVKTWMHAILLVLLRVRITVVIKLEAIIDTIRGSTK